MCLDWGVWPLRREWYGRKGRSPGRAERRWEGKAETAAAAAKGGDAIDGGEEGFDGGARDGVSVCLGYRHCGEFIR